jgi:hypothetical protein
MALRYSNTTAVYEQMIVALCEESARGHMMVEVLTTAIVLQRVTMLVFGAEN